MDRRKESSNSGVEDDETRSMFSMQELDPSPVDDLPPDMEGGDYFPKVEEVDSTNVEGFPRLAIPKLGLGGHRWDYWLSALQKYSTYSPTVFLALHLANTSLIPLATRSISSSESFLLLTRPVYQSPSLEHVVLTIPILTHIASGLALRSIRARRRARLYGSETGTQRSFIRWPNLNLQAKLGYTLIPLLGLHVLVMRATPLLVEGGSSGVGLGYASHGIARSPIFWNAFYVIFVATGVWHFAGGWAAWIGWRVTTTWTQQSRGVGPQGGYMDAEAVSREEVEKRRKMWWIVHVISALGTAIWLAGGLGIVGRGGRGSGWESKNWDDIYRNVPVIGCWL